LMRVMIATLAAAALAMAACDRESSITASRLSTCAASLSCPPPPPPVPGPGPAYMISGVVYDNTPSGRRPVSGVALAVRSGRDGMVTSDSLGAYTAPVWGDVVRIAPAVSSAYMSPCPAGSDGVGQWPGRPFDVDVVSADLLTTSGLPDSYHVSALFVSGTVTENTPQGTRAVAGASVILGAIQPGVAEPLDTAFSSSVTLTDASGRYLVCTVPPGVGTDQQSPVVVRKAGYVTASRSVLPGWD